MLLREQYIALKLDKAGAPLHSFAMPLSHHTGINTPHSRIRRDELLKK
jgi:hypothetical protein